MSKYQYLDSNILELYINYLGDYIFKQRRTNVFLIENDSLNIYYSTSFANWKETVLEATIENLRVVNQNKTVYLYKRYTPIKLDIE